MELAENPKIPRKVEKVTNDEVKSTDALEYLYNHNVPVSKLSSILSIGMLGIDKRLVPTRWSITATDDTLGKRLIEKIKEYNTISNYLLFESFYLGNRFEVLFIPGEWEYENIEIYDPGCIWVTNGEDPIILQDYEPYDGRTKYADEITGAYYAARLGALEYLNRVKRQAKVLVVREITPEYWLPVGVWEIRENVRNAVKNRPANFDSLSKAIDEIDNRLVIKVDWRSKLELLSRIRSREALRRWMM